MKLGLLGVLVLAGGLGPRPAPAMPAWGMERGYQIARHEAVLPAEPPQESAAALERRYPLPGQPLTPPTANAITLPEPPTMASLQFVPASTMEQAVVEVERSRLEAEVGAKSRPQAAGDFRPRGSAQLALLCGAGPVLLLVRRTRRGGIGG